MQRCSDAVSELGAPDGARSGRPRVLQRRLRVAGALRNRGCGKSCSPRARQVKRGARRLALRPRQRRNLAAPGAAVRAADAETRIRLHPAHAPDRFRSRYTARSVRRGRREMAQASQAKMIRVSAAPAFAACPVRVPADVVNEVLVPQGLSPQAGSGPSVVPQGLSPQGGSRPTVVAIGNVPAQQQQIFGSSAITCCA